MSDNKIPQYFFKIQTAKLKQSHNSPFSPCSSSRPDSAGGDIDVFDPGSCGLYRRKWHGAYLRRHHPQ